MLKAKYSYKDEIRVLTQEAREEGRESGRAEVVRAMKSKGFSTKDIADILSIKEEVVESMWRGFRRTASKLLGGAELLRLDLKTSLEIIPKGTVSLLLS